jgi:hypothetical protein
MAYGDGSDMSDGSYTDPSPPPDQTAYDPYANGDYNNAQGQYDPTNDPANYDANGNYVGAGAYDANGNPSQGGYSGQTKNPSVWKQLLDGSGKASSNSTLGQIGKQASDAAKGAATAQLNQNAQQNDFNHALVQLFNAELGKTGLQHTFAVNDPAKFAGQTAQASQLLAAQAPPAEVVNPRTGARSPNISASFYRPLDETARGAQMELQKQAMSNLLASPTRNPVPSVSSVHSPSLIAPTGSTLANILGAAGFTSSMINTLMNAGANQQPQPAGGGAYAGATDHNPDQKF